MIEQILKMSAWVIHEKCRELIPAELREWVILKGFSLQFGLTKLTHIKPMIHFHTKFFNFFFYFEILYYPKSLSEAEAKRRSYSNKNGSYGYGFSSEFHDLTLTLFQLFLRPASLSHHSLSSSSGTSFSYTLSINFANLILLFELKFQFLLF